MYFILLFIAVLLAVLLFRQWNKRPEEPSVLGKKESEQPVIDPMPDTPQGFGYKCQWYAVKTSDTAALWEALGLSDIQPANWRSGLEQAYRGRYFITPPVNGWTLVINAMMPDLSDSGEGGPLSTAVELSRRFGEACYFGTHRVVEYHAWIKAEQGEIVRAFGYLGEQGETLLNRGGLTIEEVENGLVFSDEDAEETNVPDEEHVLWIAKIWTVDPQMREVQEEPGTGYIGTYSKAGF